MFFGESELDKRLKVCYNGRYDFETNAWRRIDMAQTAEQGKKPLFIVFDGMDGTGKTTQMRLLCDRLNRIGQEAILTAEPTDSPDGRALRRALSGKEPANNSRLAALFLLDRIGHNEEIETWLSEGKSVISDRYYYASMAYQGQGDQFEWVADMNLNCPHIRKPDGCILLDMEPEDSMARIRAGRTADELEIYETVAQQEKIRARFRRVTEYLGDRDLIITVNAAGTVDEVAERIWAAYRRIAQAKE
jgi:dTMP kinase